jgi:hypothetical protein
MASENQQLRTYETFQEAEQANFFWQLMLEAGIRAELIEAKTYFDAVLGTSQADLYHQLNIPASDFERADDIVEQAVRRQGIEDDYFLNELSNDALKEILNSPEGWSKQNYFAALVILEKRGIQIAKNDLDAALSLRFSQLQQANGISSIAKLALILVAILGFWLYEIGGMTTLAGLLLARFPDHDFKGGRQFYFNQDARSFGKTLMLISIAIIIISLLTNPLTYTFAF